MKYEIIISGGNTVETLVQQIEDKMSMLLLAFNGCNEYNHG